MQPTDTQRLDIPYIAYLVQKLAGPYTAKGGISLNYIYFNVIPKVGIPIPRARFCRYMRIDTSLYPKIFQQYVEQQYEALYEECLRRHKRRREVKLEKMFAAASVSAQPVAETQKIRQESEKEHAEQL